MLLSELTWPDVDALSRDLPVVIPIAAVEQHGHHLPLYTDSILLGEIVQRTAPDLSDSALIAPLQWLGNSHHHLDFPGTLSAPPRSYLDLLVGLVDNFLHHGFRRILLLNGHGGNDVPGKQAMFELRQTNRRRGDLLLLFSTYWQLADAPAATIPELQQTEMGHACEWETSMMLACAPHLVRAYQGIESVEPGNPFRPASRAWITKDRTDVGHIGHPKAATLEKGESLLRYFAQGVVAMAKRMQQWDGKTWDG